MHQWLTSASRWAASAPRQGLQTLHHIQTCLQNLSSQSSCPEQVACSRTTTNSSQMCQDQSVSQAQTQPPEQQMATCRTWSRIHAWSAKKCNTLWDTSINLWYPFIHLGGDRQHGAKFIVQRKYTMSESIPHQPCKDVQVAWAAWVLGMAGDLKGKKKTSQKRKNLEIQMVDPRWPPTGNQKQEQKLDW